MRTAVRRAQQAPVVMATARSIVGVVSDPMTRARFLRSWLVQHTQFAPDPDEVELVRTPVEQLRRIAVNGIARGDCDDVAVVGAALAQAAGLSPRFVVLGFGPGPDVPYTHVYTDVLGGAVEFDITRRPDSPRPTRMAIMEV